ncbi:GNAT family N-acetyltransferase [Bacillus massiliigorillae]|uniref:GNAT family N-acetyltransferase n=1 Tax=Bacillus massiliigorillae TaxID=1243664 RepID=UPI0003A46797|nr:GNAT family N-acetyltransferase [Bacillus massiliigorillae]
MKDIIETDRLRLIPKTLELIKASFYGRESLEKSLGFYVCEGFLDEDYQTEIFPLHYARITDDPSLSRWSGFIIEKSNKMLIGSAGFEDKPDENGVIEVRFYIHPFFRGKGYGTEILLALKDLYIEKEEVNSITATRISPDNIAAIKVLQKIGMGLEKHRANELYFAIHKKSYLNSK